MTPTLDAENYLEGNVGYLTWQQFDRLRRAVQNAHTHIGWWRIAGHIKSGDADEHKTRSTENPLPLPATWLAADEITRLLHELNVWPELEDAANDQWGSVLALDFVREVETAMHKWPICDRPHRVRYFRCQACQQLTLRYYPPTFRDHQILDSVVKCTDRTCGAIVDSLMFERMAVLAEHENRNRSLTSSRTETP